MLFSCFLGVLGVLAFRSSSGSRLIKLALIGHGPGLVGNNALLKRWSDLMRSVLFLVLVSINVLFGASATPAQQSESVQAIMAKVARNQDQAQEIRSAFVYNQTLLLRFRQGDGKTCREELREFTVAPTSKDTHKTLTRFLGKYLKAGKLIDYTEPGYHYKSLDLDSDLMTGFADGF